MPAVSALATCGSQDAGDCCGACPPGPSACGLVCPEGGEAAQAALAPATSSSTFRLAAAAAASFDRLPSQDGAPVLADSTSGPKESPPLKKYLLTHSLLC